MWSRRLKCFILFIRCVTSFSYQFTVVKFAHQSWFVSHLHALFFWLKWEKKWLAFPSWIACILPFHWNICWFSSAIKTGFDRKMYFIWLTRHQLKILSKQMRCCQKYNAYSLVKCTSFSARTQLSLIII